VKEVAKQTDRISHEDHPFVQGTELHVNRSAFRDSAGDPLGGDLAGCDAVVTSTNALYTGEDGKERVTCHLKGGPLFAVPVDKVRRLSGRISFGTSGAVGRALERIFGKKKRRS
jgi:hypothetical protein